MDQILPYVVPGGMALAGVLAILIGFGLLLSGQRWLLFGFIACLVLLASSSTYGLEEGADSNVFWVKGSRTFFFSFIEMGMVGAWLALLYRRAWQGTQPLGQTPAEPWLPMSKYYVALALLLLGHVLMGLLEPRHSWVLDVSMRGFGAVLYQGMFVVLVVSTLRTERDLRIVLWLLLLALAGRHLFGLVRYVGFGGDPQNAYAVLGGSKVKLTFWDINDSIFAAVMFALCAWLVLTGKALSLGQRVLLLAGGGMSLLIPLLSARRTGQAGMLLAIAMLAALLPRGRRLPALLALVLAVPLVLVALGKRADTTTGSLIDRVLIDVKTDRFSDPRRSRFHELSTAWQTIKESPVFGLGPSGRFKVNDPTGLEYHGGNYDFVHSGFGHMLLKGGFVGLALFCGVFLSWALLLRRGWHVLRGPPQALAVAAVCGFAASLPNLLVGTPVPEIRTMLGMGLLMALPIAAIRICRARTAVAPATVPGRAAPPLLRPGRAAL